ncbi:MAG: TetR/AcrR family transcriptional regulator, partial [Steroidobacteraceae bacterium]|nr:TetR/AcrR family transcriptional regulator [Steroidobacteraceae bacterium]
MARITTTVTSRRSVSRKPDIVRARILDAAQAEFMRYGYADASTNRMLRRFAGSKPTMFRHFPTKRRLFLAVVDRITGQWQMQREVWRRLDATAPRSWLCQFGTTALEWLLTDDALFVGRMTVCAGDQFPELVSKWTRLVHRPMRLEVARQLRAWHARMLVDCRDPRRDADCFLDMLLSGPVSRALYGARGRPSRPSLGKGVRYAVDRFLKGLLPR